MKNPIKAVKSLAVKPLEVLLKEVAATREAGAQVSAVVIPEKTSEKQLVKELKTKLAEGKAVEEVATNKTVNENIGKLNSGIDLLVKEMSLTRKAVNSMYEAQEQILKVKMQEAGKLIAQLHSELDQITYSKGFYDGRNYLVTTAENMMVKNLGFKSREELSISGKMPVFWVATLVTCLTDPPSVSSKGWVIDEKKASTP